VVRLGGGLCPIALVVTLALTGCGEDVQQQAAREETQAFVRASATAADYDVEETHCTESARTAIFRIEETAMFLCAVRRVDGGCDWFRLDAEGIRERIRLADRDAGCVLPE
jgi:uncharacterized protein YceK